MRPWQAEVAIDEGLVRSLLAEQFPELDGSSARLLGEGWDNSVWLVEERLAFRIPRRAIAVPLVERELAVLPRLASLLPALVPVPTHTGIPSARFPWPFFAAPLLDGSEPAVAAVDDEDRVALGADLGRFLKALHMPATRAVVDPEGALPVDPNRRADMAVRVERTREAVERLGALGIWSAPPELERVLTAAESLLPSNEERLLHGDLHVRHVLVDHGRLTGVIDWGDVCVGDPAIDLTLFWSFLSEVGRASFLSEYGPVEEERLLRARVLAVFLNAILVAYARDVGHASLELECLVGLERTLVDRG